MTNKFFVKTIIVLAASFPAHSWADPLKISAPILGELLLTEDGRGFYTDLMDEVLHNLDQPYVFTPLPFKRLLTAFETYDIDCLWTFDKSFLAKLSIDTRVEIASQDVFHATQHIFMAPGTKSISKLDELQGKRVGIGIGSNLESRLNQVNAKISKLSDQNSKFRMLTKGRLDAIGGWIPELLILSQEEGVDPSVYSRSSTLETTGIAFVCHPSEESETFIANVDIEIDRYKRSNQFEDLLKRYGAGSMFQGANK